MSTVLLLALISAHAWSSQIDALFEIRCVTTNTTLTVSWQPVKRIQLAANASYTVRLREGTGEKRLVKQADIQPNISTSCYFKELFPEGVENLKAAYTTSSTILLRWSPPVRLNGKLKEYQLSFKIINQSHFQTINVTDMQIHKLTHLREKTEYVIRVLAITGAGKGALVETRTTTLIIPTITDVITNLKSRVLNWDTIEVSWTPIKPEQEVTSYNLRYCPSEVVCSIVNTTESVVQVTDLHPLSSYALSVQGINKRGAGSWSRSSNTDFTPDRDECKDGVHNCSKFASCENTEGSFKCTCLSMYIGDGIMCKGLLNECSEEYFCQSEEVQNILWERTTRGQTSKRPCPRGTLGDATRRCKIVNNKALWEQPNLWSCTSKQFRDFQSQTSEESFDVETTVRLVERLELLTDPAHEMFGGDFQVTLDVLSALGEKSFTNHSQMAQDKAQEISATVVNITNNLLSGPAKKVWKDTPMVSRATGLTKLIDCLETIALATAALSNSSDPFVVEMSSVVLVTQSFTNTEAEDVVTYPRIPNSTTVAAIIPLHEILNKDGPTQVSYTYFHQIGELLGSVYESPELNANTSPISSDAEAEEDDNRMAVSPSVTSISTSRKNTTNFDKPIQLFLENPKGKDLVNPSCAFWKVTRHGGLWSPKGCVVNDSNSSRTVCHCYHLTSFAILMQYMPATQEIPVHHLFYLSLISHIGIGISLVALVLAFITFCSINFLSSSRNFVHGNLVLSMIMAEVLFVAGINKTENQLGCTIIAVFLHYFFLVVFCWMASEGVVLYLMLVKVLPSTGGAPRRRILFLCSWGLPSFPVVLAVIFYRQGYGNQHYCWLSLHDGFIWCFIGPVLFVCLVNLVFLALTFKTMAERKKISPVNRVQPHRIRYWAKACAVLMCLLGTTWLLGLFFVDQQSVAMAYLFNIFNTLQGLFIFIFHCLADERIRKEYIRILCCRGSRRDSIRQSVGKTQSKHTLTTRTDRKTVTSEGKGQESSEMRDSVCDPYAGQIPIQVFDYYEDSSAPSSPAYQRQFSREDKNDREGKELIYGLKLPRTLDELAERLVQRDEEEESQIDYYGENLSGSLFGGALSPLRRSMSPPPYHELSSPTFCSNHLQEVIEVSEISPRLPQKFSFEPDCTLDWHSLEGEESDDGAIGKLVAAIGKPDGAIREPDGSIGKPDVSIGKPDGSIGKPDAEKDVQTYDVALVRLNEPKLERSDFKSSLLPPVGRSGEVTCAEFSRAPTVFYIDGDNSSDSPSNSRHVSFPRDVRDRMPREQSRDTTEGAYHGKKKNQLKYPSEAEGAGTGKQPSERPLRGLFRKPWVSGPKCLRKNEKLQPDSGQFLRSSTQQQERATPSSARPLEQASAATEPCRSYSERRFPNAKVLLLEGTPGNSFGAIASSDSCEDLDNKIDEGLGSADKAGVNRESSDVRSLILRFEAEDLWKKRS